MEVERAGLAARNSRRAPARMSATGLSAPHSHGSETVGADGQFHFDVPITLPLIGTIVHYKGNLKPIEMSGESLTGRAKSLAFVRANMGRRIRHPTRARSISMRELQFILKNFLVVIFFSVALTF